MHSGDASPSRWCVSLSSSELQPSCFCNHWQCLARCNSIFIFSSSKLIFSSCIFLYSSSIFFIFSSNFRFYLELARTFLRSSFLPQFSSIFFSSSIVKFKSSNMSIFHRRELFNSDITPRTLQLHVFESYISTKCNSNPLQSHNLGINSKYEQNLGHTAVESRRCFSRIEGRRLPSPRWCPRKPWCAVETGGRRRATEWETNLWKSDGRRRAWVWTNLQIGLPGVRRSHGRATAGGGRGGCGENATISGEMRPLWSSATAELWSGKVCERVRTTVGVRAEGRRWRN